jgi:hypothetical protein
MMHSDFPEIEGSNKMARRPNTAGLKPVPTPDNAAIPLDILTEVVKATVSGGFVYKNATAVAKLVDLALVEQNAELTNEAGDFATRATATGVDYMNAHGLQTFSDASAAAPQSPPVPVPVPVPAAASPSKFERRKVVDLPIIKRGGPGRAPKFPFDDLVAPVIGADGKPVYDAFFVPVSNEYPEPAKSLASTVSSANARYAVDTGEMENVTVSVYQTDANGKRVKSEGHYVKTGEKAITRSKTRQTREFSLRAEDGGALILRTA